MAFSQQLSSIVHNIMIDKINNQSYGLRMLFMSLVLCLGSICLCQK